MADNLSRFSLVDRAYAGRRKTSARAVLFLAAIVLANCAPTGSNLPMLDNAAQTGPTDYRLGAGDKIKITVLGAQDISGEYTISDAGTISAPLIGEVGATGLSTVDLEKTVAHQLSGGVMKDPKVTVAVLAYRPFYIFGEVTKPGSYPYASGMRVLSAVATAGGFTYRAEESYVVVTRHGEDRKALPSMTVLPDDIIRIPERYF